MLALPDSYVNIAPTQFNGNEHSLPPKTSVKIIDGKNIDVRTSKEIQWTDHVKEVVESLRESLEAGQCVS